MARAAIKKLKIRNIQEMKATKTKNDGKLATNNLLKYGAYVAKQARILDWQRLILRYLWHLMLAE